MISVALTTFNGSKYIRGQIASILRQTLPPNEIIICDDGSTDGTVDILEEIAKAEKKVKVYKNEVSLGVSMNFQKAIGLCRGDYIALSDQDDIWMDNKLKLTLEELKKAEKKSPAWPVLVHTDLEVVGESLDLISPSFWEYAGINPRILRTFNFLGVCNSITGCTVVFNRPLKHYIFPFPKEIVMHDTWIGLCAAKYGTVSFVEEPTVKYRQHAGNALGAIKKRKSLHLRIVNFKRNMEFNRRYYRMVRRLNYGSPLKYLIFKTIYAFIRP